MLIIHTCKACGRICEVCQESEVMEIPTMCPLGMCPEWVGIKSSPAI